MEFRLKLMARTSGTVLALIVTMTLVLMTGSLEAQSWGTSYDIQFEFPIQVSPGGHVIIQPVVAEGQSWTAPRAVKVYMTAQAYYGTFPHLAGQTWAFRMRGKITYPTTWGTAPDQVKVEFAEPASGNGSLGSTGGLKIQWSKPTAVCRNAVQAYQYKPDNQFAGTYLHDPDPKSPHYQGTLSGAMSWIRTVEEAPGFPRVATVEVLNGKGWLDASTKKLSRELDVLKQGYATESKGLAADGAARLLVRVKDLSDTSHIKLVNTSFNAGLADPWQPELGGPASTRVIKECQDYVHIEPATGRGYAFFEIRAPSAYLPPNHDPLLTPERPLQIEVHIRDRVVKRSLKIVRAPTVFAHGLWSSWRTWSGKFAVLANNRLNGFPALAMDYSITHAEGFHVNAPLCRPWIAAARSLVEQQGLAVGCVNWVGHSMGGLLPRVYFNQEALADRWAAPDNYYSGPIRKLILIHSPQDGSPLGNVASVARRSALWPFLDQVLGHLGASASFGKTLGPALDDLSEQSPYFKLTAFPPGRMFDHLFPFPVPTHAIAGVGVEKVIQNATKSLSGAITMLNRIPVKNPYVLGVMKILEFADVALGYSVDKLYGGEEHDLVVTKRSQLAGFLESDRWTTVNRDSSVPWPKTLHTSATGWDTVYDRVLALLDHAYVPLMSDFYPFAPAPAGGRTGLPDGPQDAGVTVVSGKIQLGVSSSIQNLQPGARFTVQVASQIPEPVVSCRLIDSFGTVLTTSALQPFVLTVPNDWLGGFSFFVMARGQSGTVYPSNVLSGGAGTAAAVTGISVAPTSILLRAPGATHRIEVTLHLANASSVRVPWTYPGLTFQAVDSRRVGVNAGGVVTSRAQGRTEVVVKLGAFQERVALESVWKNPMTYGTANEGALSLRAVLDLPTGVPVIGKTVTFRTSKLTPGTQGVLVLGLEPALVHGAGFDLYVGNHLAVLPLVAQGSGLMNGVADFSIPLPPEAGLVGLPIFAQTLFLDGLAPSGLVASPGLYLSPVKP
jgi:pimeloyl-ACP methyl ester carboxylesterase